MADRRAHILATTRQLMAESDGAVPMRRLAEQSGVALATIYNIFGGQDGLVAAALAEMFNERLPRWQEEPDTSLFGVVDRRLIAMVAEALREPVFAKRMSLRFFTHGPLDGTARLLNDLPMRFGIEQAQSLRKADHFRPDIDIQTWADDQLIVSIAVIARWASGHIPDDQLEDRTRGAVFAHLRGSLTAQGISALDAYLRHR